MTKMLVMLRLEEPVLDFKVYGEAHPAGSKKSFQVARKNPRPGQKKTFIASTHDNRKTRPWMDEVQQAAGRVAEALEVLDGPIYCLVTAYRVRPKSHLRADETVKPRAPAWPATAPDLTKLVRAIEDALEEAKTLSNDSRVCLQINTKEWAHGKPFARIRLGHLKAGDGYVGEPKVEADRRIPLGTAGHEEGPLAIEFDEAQDRRRAPRRASRRARAAP